MGLLSRGDGDDAVGLGYEPRGDYPTAKRLAKIESVLDEGERVEYLTRGGNVDVEGAGSGESVFGTDRSNKTGTRGWIRAGFTDRRIVIKIPQWLGSDERSIPYQSVVGIDLDTGLVKKRISVQTAGPTYHIEVDLPGKDECREIVKYVRERSMDAQSGAATSGSGENTPAERLREVESLHEDGLLDGDEYEAKRAALLEQL
jgi:hypothetical protein